MNDLVYKGKWIYNWFSNFQLSPIIVDDNVYPSVENYYQSQKTLNLEERKQFETCFPSKAKKLGRSVKLRDDWEQVKLEVMEKALRIKFVPGTVWYDKLMETEGEIVEWNNWGDRFWGKTLDGKGENHLGKILIKIRDGAN